MRLLKMSFGCTMTFFLGGEGYLLSFGAKLMTFVCSSIFLISTKQNWYLKNVMKNELLPRGHLSLGMDRGEAILGDNVDKKWRLFYVFFGKKWLFLRIVYCVLFFLTGEKLEEKTESDVNHGAVAIEIPIVVFVSVPDCSAEIWNLRKPPQLPDFSTEVFQAWKTLIRTSDHGSGFWLLVSSAVELSDFFESRIRRVGLKPNSSNLRFKCSRFDSTASESTRVGYLISWRPYAFKPRHQMYFSSSKINFTIIFRSLFFFSTSRFRRVSTPFFLETTDTFITQKLRASTCHISLWKYIFILKSQILLFYHKKLNGSL